MATRQTLTDILAPGHFKITVNDVEQWPEEYSGYFNVDSSSRRQETGSEVTGFGLAPIKQEGANMDFDDTYQGYDETFIHDSYVLGYRVSEELYEDDLYRVINKLPKELSYSFMQTVEVIGAGLLNNGFTDSAAYLGPDGEPLFGDATTRTHPQPPDVGGTWQNQLSTPADLNMDTLELLVELLESQVDARGLPAMYRAKTLFVPQEEKFNAIELLHKQGMMEKPQTTERGVNPMIDEDITPKVGHWLTDPDAVFLRATAINTQWFWRVKFGGENSLRYWDDEGPGVMNARGRMRLSMGWWNGRGWVGSPGA